jgi:energy-coupling factor transporter ATP-binding protein EcfA2
VDVSEPAAIREIYARPLTTVTMKSIEWLEKPLWQRSAFQLLAGPKGSGKGTYLAALAARITNAGQNALFVSTEDSAEIDLKPRLVAAGADIARCFDITQHIDLPQDIGALQQLGASMQPLGLFVIDPVANHIGDRDSNAEAAIRDAIAPLNGLANDLGCLLIGVRHPGKDRARGALASVLGSTAWVDVPRAVVFIAKDDQNQFVRHIQVVAGNRALNGKANHFRIEPCTVEGLTEPITRAIDLGESEKNVDDLLALTLKEPSKTDKAKVLLLDILEEKGDQNSDTLDAEVASKVGLASKTIRNVRAELKDEGLIGIRPVKDEETEMVDHWVVYRTLEPRPGNRLTDKVPDLENEDGPFVSQQSARPVEAESGPLSTKPKQAEIENGLTDKVPGILNGQSGTGSNPTSPTHNLDGPFVYQAKNGEAPDGPFVKQAKKPEMAYLPKCPTPAEHAREAPSDDHVYAPTNEATITDDDLDPDRWWDR